MMIQMSLRQRRPYGATLEQPQVIISALVRLVEDVLTIGRNARRSCCACAVPELVQRFQLSFPGEPVALSAVG
jgi:hypothetical protein